MAQSGAALFVSVDPQTIQPGQKAAFRAAMQTALSGGAPGGGKPLDWLHTTAPEEWLLGQNQTHYHWEESFGTNPLKV